MSFSVQLNSNYAKEKLATKWQTIGHSSSICMSTDFLVVRLKGKTLWNKHAYKKMVYDISTIFKGLPFGIRGFHNRVIHFIALPAKKYSNLAVILVVMRFYSIKKKLNYPCQHCDMSLGESHSLPFSSARNCWTFICSKLVYNTSLVSQLHSLSSIL